MGGPAEVVRSKASISRPLTLCAQELPLQSVLTQRTKRRGPARQAPALLALCFAAVPPGRRLRVSARFSRAFLTLTQHPPDAHRGVDLPPAVLLPAGPGQLQDLGSQDAGWQTRSCSVLKGEGAAEVSGRVGQGIEQDFTLERDGAEVCVHLELRTVRHPDSGGCERVCCLCRACHKWQHPACSSSSRPRTSPCPITSFASAPQSWQSSLGRRSTQC